MLSLDFSRPREFPYKILCLGAHADDIEIGCGGTVLTLLDLCPNAEFHWIVFSSNQQRAVEAQDSADSFLGKAREKHVVVESFRESFFPYRGEVIKEYFESLKKEAAPDIIFTHYGKDLHQDHAVISQLTWNTFRDHLILEYEIPKYDGDFGSPNLYVHLDEKICRKKIELILRHFKSQENRDWFGEETFRAIMRLRGVESNAAGKYAEAFYCRKLVLGGPCRLVTEVE